MVEASQKTSAVSEQDFATLDAYAEKNLTEAARLSEVTVSEPPLVQRGAIYLTAVALGFTACLLYFGKVPVWVTSKGYVIPEGESVSVQTIESGVVTEVLAEVGERLPKGTPLVTIDRTQSNLNLAELQRELTLQQKQLQALTEDAAVIRQILSAPEAFLIQSTPVKVNSSNILQLINAFKQRGLEKENAQQMNADNFEQRKQQILREIDLARQQIALLERHKQIAVINLQKDTEILREKQQRLEETRSLVQEGYLSKIELDTEQERYRTAESALEESKKQLENQELELSNQKVRLSEQEIQLQSLTTETSQQYKLALNNYRQSINNLRQSLENINSETKKINTAVENIQGKLKLTETQIVNTSVNMPLNGTLGQLNIKNPGELVSAGAVIAVVIPKKTPLTIKAVVPNKDIGFVQPGLDARIKVDAFPFQQFGTVPAKVKQVFPNVGDEDNFTITLELLQDNIKAGNKKIYLFPGLAVKAEVKTRRQRLFQLLFGKKSGNKPTQ